MQTTRTGVPSMCSLKRVGVSKRMAEALGAYWRKVLAVVVVSWAIHPSLWAYLRRIPLPMSVVETTALALMGARSVSSSPVGVALIPMALMPTALLLSPSVAVVVSRLAAIMIVVHWSIWAIPTLPNGMPPICLTSNGRAKVVPSILGSNRVLLSVFMARAPLVCSPKARATVATNRPSRLTSTALFLRGVPAQTTWAV